MPTKFRCSEIRQHAYSSSEYKAWLYDDNESLGGLYEVLRKYKNRVATLNHALLDEKPYIALEDFYYFSFATEQEALAFQIRGLKFPKE